MATWTIGDVEITRVVEFNAIWTMGGKGTMVEEGYPEALLAIDWLSPHFITPEGHAKLAIQALLIQTPTKRIIVDTCAGNDKDRGGSGDFHNLQTPFLRHMEEVGWSRDSVDVVLCTHLHVDHVGWNTMLVGGKWVPTFPKARYLFGRREWEFWSKIKDGRVTPVLADSIQPVIDAGLADLIEETHQITPEVRVRPTPGHTPGHISVMISSKRETAAITGDMMHHPCQIAHPRWSSGFDTNQTQGNETRASFLAEMEAAGTLLIGTHFSLPTAGHVVKDGDGYRLNF